MQLNLIPALDIGIPKNRQRKVFDPVQLTELANSIADNGIINPITVRKQENGEIALVAGERRMRALEIVWNFGQEVRCGGKVIPEGIVPCLYLGQIDPIDAFEIELEENIRRTDLDWKEKAIATSQLFELRTLQAARDNKPAPTPADIAREISSEEAAGKSNGELGDIATSVKQDIILARNLYNPVVAAATSRREAFKALKREEDNKRHEELGRSVGSIFHAGMHTLLRGDCIKLLEAVPASSFDVILSDPPYGIDAQDFGDSGGKAGAHFYDDSYSNWQQLMAGFVIESFRIAKSQAHLYLFCDIDRFHELRGLCETHGWEPFRTPFIAVNPTAMRAPWPESGPQRKWQAILYCVKGKKPVTRIYSDVLTYPSDANLGHQAQKPVALYMDLLRRSVRPGDLVLDPFCGSGPIFPAAHELKCKATGMEMNEAAYGIAAKRIQELK